MNNEANGTDLALPRLAELATEIHALQTNIGRDLIAMGRMLNEARSLLLSDPAFGKWRTANTSLDQRSAHRAMELARMVDAPHPDTVSDKTDKDFVGAIEREALAYLVRDGTAEDRDVVIAAKQSGVLVTLDDAKKIVEDRKAAKAGTQIYQAPKVLLTPPQSAVDSQADKPAVGTPNAAKPTASFEWVTLSPPAALKPIVKWQMVGPSPPEGDKAVDDECQHCQIHCTADEANAVAPAEAKEEAVVTEPTAAAKSYVKLAAAQQLAKTVAAAYIANDLKGRASKTDLAEVARRVIVADGAEDDAAIASGKFIAEGYWADRKLAGRGARKSNHRDIYNVATIAARPSA